MSSLFANHEADLGPLAAGAADDASARYARIALERGIDRVRGGGTGAENDGTLTYRCDEGTRVGERVEVPLGRGAVKSAGIVVATGGPELLEGLAPHRVKPILARTGARLPENLIELARWMAGYYVCPLGMVLATMMPAAVKRAIGLKRRTLIDRPPLPPTPTGDTSPAETPKLTAATRQAWEAIAALPADVFPAPPREVMARIGASSLGPINRLIKAGLLQTIQREEVPELPAVWDQLRVEPGRAGVRPELTPAQRRIVEGIAPTLGGFCVHLLRGVTGSGKTEVYLRIIETVLGQEPSADGAGPAASAVVLVPEISLTPQTAGRFIDRFGGPGGIGVAVLHSGLTSSQRHRQWAMVASGQARVVVGARSAVFAPLLRPRVIVVDEEHASDYKQDQLPRYHARDVAIKRAQLEGCPVILGSATPSLESWANARSGATGGGTGGGGGKYRLWELTERVGGGSLPRVHIVDTPRERRDAGQAGEVADRRKLIGPTLAAAMQRTLGDGGQAILLLNRRGFASYIGCPSERCGWSMRCTDCEASLVYHRPRLDLDRGYLRCHHCQAEQMMPRKCPLCERKPIALGAGTQRVEDELARTFGLVSGETMLRADGDTMQSASDWFEALSRFARGEIRVLLGTQMIAKGLDYPNVRLVGVVDGDTALSLPDFRAAERTFQLISQVAGRAGRGTAPGTVIVQTLNPDYPAIRLAATHDYPAFAQQELAVRARSGLPPMTRMARIVVRDTDHAKAMRIASELVATLRAAAESAPRSGAAPNPQSPAIRIDDPLDCPLSRIATFHRVGIDLVARRRGDIQSVLAAARAKGLVKSDARTAVDVDPIALM